MPVPLACEGSGIKAVKFWIDDRESYGLIVAKFWIEDGRGRGGGKEGISREGSIGECIVIYVCCQGSQPRVKLGVSNNPTSSRNYTITMFGGSFLAVKGISSVDIINPSMKQIAKQNPQ